MGSQRLTSPHPLPPPGTQRTHLPSSPAPALPRYNRDPIYPGSLALPLDPRYPREHISPAHLLSPGTAGAPKTPSTPAPLPLIPLVPQRRQHLQAPQLSPLVSQVPQRPHHLAHLPSCPGTLGTPDTHLPGFLLRYSKYPRDNPSMLLSPPLVPEVTQIPVVPPPIPGGGVLIVGSHRWCSQRLVIPERQLFSLL